jgi:hypothetical protein
MISDTDRATAIEATRELAELIAEPYRVPEDRLITQPGLYDVPMRDYVADPVAGGSLSSSGARLIIKPGGPARLRWKLDNPDGDHKDAFDLGRAAHQVVLGDHENHIRVIEGSINARGNTEWRTNDAKRKVDETRAAGLTPIKPETWEQVQAMARAIADHPTAAGLILSASGQPEHTLVWRDDMAGVWCRARVDWFRTKKAGHRLLIVDYKTTADLADPETFGKPAARYGYYIQAEFYRTGIRALGLDEDPAFVLIVQEKDPPNLVNVVELDDTALTLGRNKMRSALNTFAECRRTGNWPGFGPEIDLVSLPAWFLRSYDEVPE